MPTKKTATVPAQKVQKGIDDPVRFRMGQTGNLGLRITSGTPLEETVRELQWPNNLRIYQTMQNDSVIAAAVDFFRMMIRKSSWSVIRSANDSPEDKRYQDLLDEMLFQDMQDSFGSFLQEVSSFLIYGHSVHEIVYRRRETSTGSRFNDGLIGIKKLAPRSQASLEKFIYEGDDLVGIKQNTNLMQGSAFRTYTQSSVVLPINKLLLFRTGTSRENPVGRSPLAAVFHDWKARCAIAESESIGSIRDLGGIPVLYAPAQIMSPDASDDQKATYEYMKNMVRNLHAGHQSGVVLPNVFDEASKQRLFEIKLLNVDGGRLFDSNAIIERYNKSILTKLCADILIMGQSSSGSYALGTIKSQLTALAAETYLTEIKDVINNDLVRRVFNLNGIKLSKYPQVEFDPMTGSDMEVFSKFIQRVKSVGMIDVSVETLNAVRNTMGLEDLPDDFDLALFKEENSKSQSKAGEGMKTPFEGTSTGGGDVEDNSVSNSENA